MFPVPWSSRWSWSLHLFVGRPMFLRPFGLYFSACFGSLFVSILCTCCSHFSWYCFISFTMFCAPVFPLIHWFFSLSSFVIPSRCLKNFICAASKRCSSHLLSTQASLPNFNASLAVMLWILNFLCSFSKMSPYSSVLVKNYPLILWKLKIFENSPVNLVLSHANSVRRSSVREICPTEFLGFPCVQRKSGRSIPACLLSLR